MSDEPLIDAAYVTSRLEAAHLTLHALPGRAGPARLGARTYGYVPELIEGAPSGQPLRVSPSRADIAAMDEAMAWLALIGNDVRRRIVAARSITNRATGKPIYSWRAIATLVGASHEAMRGWYDRGIGEIVRGLGGVA